MSEFRPSDEAQLVDIVAASVAREEPLEVVAGGSKRGLGRPLQTPHTLELGAFSGIRLYEPEELVLTAGAATPLAEIETALEAAGQMLAFEPGDWGPLFGAKPGAQTLGGVLACNLAGPRRIRQGAARDHLLGFRAVSGRGEAFKAGGRVVKNVTGYDLSKLMAGSYGTLAVLTEVSVKVLPRPETTGTVVLHGLGDAAALGAMTLGLNSSHEVSGAAHFPEGEGGKAMTALRLEGPEPSVAARAAALMQELAALGACEVRYGADALAPWRRLRDVEPFAGHGDRVVWRVSVPPTAGPLLVAGLAGVLDVHHFFDWGGGLVWLAVAGAEDGGAAAIRGALARLSGHATLIRAADPLRAAIAVFEPQPAPLAALTRRVKESFDPRRILNPGRMYRDL